MSHDHCDAKGCSCSCHSCTCCKKAGHHEEECCFSTKLIEMADDAWMCLLKEKIKAQIEKTSGKQLDNLAKIVSDANHSRWKHKMNAKNECDHFKQQVEDFFKHK